MDVSFFDPVHARIGDPLDVAIAQFALEQALGIPDTVKTEVPNIGFRRHERHRNLVANAPFAQLGVEDHRKFVRRTEAGCAVRRSDHDRAGRLAESFERSLRLFGVVDMTDRLGESVRSQALDFIERQLGSGSDDEIVIAYGPAILEFDTVFRCMNTPGARVEKAYPLALHHGRQADLDCFSLAPPDRHPWVGGDEMPRSAL